jgi:putative Mg2+ transporter-C (MgtC) family protein
MPLVPDLWDLALRIVLTLLAAAAIGYERGTHGKAAGLRTTLLVALAACLAMIQVNLLLTVDGKTGSSFAVMDVMRLPLGILTGVGFIGAGTIIKRGATVIGVTTAASMWFVTVIGLLFGGGQIWLGVAGSLIGVAVIEGLRAAEGRLARDHQATLSVRLDRRRVGGDEIAALLAQPPFTIERSTYSFAAETQTEERSFHMSWRARRDEVAIPAVVKTVAEIPGVLSVRWDAGGMADG